MLSWWSLISRFLKWSMADNDGPLKVFTRTLQRNRDADGHHLQRGAAFPLLAGLS
jgi:hypothetical protein